MFLGFMLRGVIANLKRSWDGNPAPKADANRMQDMLSRERVTLHMEVEKVHSNSLD
jgi:hypothetical protein